MGENRTCSFCEQYNFFAQEPDRRGAGFIVKDYLKAGLIVESERFFDTGEKSHAGTYRGRGHPLRFCPTCGKRLKKVRKKRV